MSDLMRRLPGTPEDASLVVLADTSDSMRGDKIVRLRRELQALWPERPEARLLCFGGDLTWAEGPHRIPDPHGSTPLKEALEAAAGLWPGEVLVISDGLPDDRDGALAAARRLPGTISVLFVGGDEDLAGADFLRLLATIGGGQVVHKDLAKHAAIGGELRALLALPPPIAL